MKKVRVIPRLEIKGENLIKGIQLEGLRVIGNPAKHAHSYYRQGADELIYTDVVASLYSRNSLHDVISATAAKVFVPMTVGGGVRSTDDVESLLQVGADKVSLNTAAVANKDLITSIANKFGSQCCVLEVQAKQFGDDNWMVMVDNGREHTGLNVISWVQQGVKMGAGEILLTSIDRDGTRSGLDINLIKKVTSTASVPVIASGGVGRPEDVAEALTSTRLHSIAIADLFHYARASIREVKLTIQETGLRVRE